MDFNKIATDIVGELKSNFHRTDTEIAERLGISRQAYLRRRDNNALTSEDLTVLSAWLIAGNGGGFYLNKILNEEEAVKKLSEIMQLAEELRSWLAIKGAGIRS